MKYELFDFQRDAVTNVLKRMSGMRTLFETDGSLSAVSLTAPTGAGKTVISAAIAEGLFYGDDTFPGDDSACILWLSDSPSLNEQTIRRFDEATDLINSATNMEAITNDFAKANSKLKAGHVYFLNRQLLSSSGKLAKSQEGGRNFYDVLSETILDTETHLYLFIDEAHRGIGSEGTSDSANKTIYSKLIDGQDGINPPMPIVIGISATAERFNNAMNGRKNRNMMAPIDVPVSEVRSSGLIKDTIELRTPKESADTKHQDLTMACKKLANTTKIWKEYCAKNAIPTVTPLMIVQVEDRISEDMIASLCLQIHKTLPWLDINDCFANVFGEHSDIKTKVATVPYCKPEEVSNKTEIRVLFAKDAISTGWDCPRAEVIYSRRKRNDPTYIAQMLGRMIRTPLARRIDSHEELNSVSCYLPEYDATTVESVVEKLKEDNIAVETTSILKNPVDVGWFGETKAKVEKKLSDNTTSETRRKSKNTKDNTDKTDDLIEKTDLKSDDEYIVVEDPDDLDADNIILSDKEKTNLTEVLERMPKADSDDIKSVFESIITRTVRHDKADVFLDLWDCIDIVICDLDMDSKLDEEIKEEFYNNVEGNIIKHPAEFKRTLNNIKSTTMFVKRVDPLTGEVFEDREEQAVNDSERLVAYYRDAVKVFSGATDYIKYYIAKREEEALDNEAEAISRISAVAYCIEVIADLEKWAEARTEKLLSMWGSFRESISDENRDKWNRIEGNTRPYIERNLRSQASVTRMNKDYDKYEKHIITAEDGYAYLNLSPLEKKVVERELSIKLNVAWYRNQPRNLNASLSIPYKLHDQWENMYPDFVFFQKNPDGSIRASIVDPHGDWLGDSIAKLQGYVLYLKDHPKLFTRCLAVTDETDGKYYALDLMDKSVQKAVESFTGNTAKSLFKGPLGKEYSMSAHAT